MKIRIALLLLFLYTVFPSPAAAASPELEGIFSLENRNDPFTGTPALRFFLNGKNGSGNGADTAGTPVKEKRFWRAVAYMGTIWIIDSIRYWATYADWVEDWQFQLSWKDQSRRFFSLDANKFDSNPFQTNWGHGVGGAIFFNIARYHNLSIFESVLFESATSLIWEYVTEWREVVSINDNFFSGLGGLPIGEPFYQLSKYLLSKRGILNHIAGYMINPIFAVSDLFGGKRWRSHFTEDYDLPPGTWLALSNENVDLRESDGFTGNRLAMDIHSVFRQIPGYGEAGEKEVKLNLARTFFSSIHFGLSVRDGGYDEYRFNTKVLYLGAFRQKITAGEAGDLKGYSFYYGLSSAYSFFKKRTVEPYDTGQYHYDFHENGEEVDDEHDVNGAPELPVNFKDKMAAISLIGPSAHLTLYSSPFRLELDAGAWFDFGLIGSLAINRYSETHDIYEDRLKTTLAYYGYYYAFGYTLDLGAALHIGNLSLRGGFKHQSYVSIQGLDRFQDRIDNDAKAYDSRSLWRGLADFRIPGTRFSVSLEVQHIARRGELEEIIVNAPETRIFTSLNIHL